MLVNVGYGSLRCRTISHHERYTLMPAVNDKYVLTLRSQATIQDPANVNPIYNVFAYQAVAGTNSANDLAAGFEAAIVPSLTGLVTVATVMHDITVINLDDPGDFDLRTITIPGTVTGDEMPMFVGFAFRYNRAIRGIHNGRKTFSVLSELAQNNGEPTASYVTALNAFANVLEGLLVASLADYAPRIWRRAGTYNVAGVPTVFPDTFYPISSVSFERISTQNSRKR